MHTEIFGNSWGEGEEAQMIVAQPKADVFERKKNMNSIPKAKRIPFNLLKCMSNYYQQKNQTAAANLHLWLNMTKPNH